MDVEPFVPAFAEKEIEDLRARLRSTRWPPALGAGGGIGLERVRALAGLMKRLGYDRYFVHGGDVGATVGTWLARRHPRQVLGLHLNYIPGSYAPDPAPGQGLAPAEEQFLRDAQAWWDRAGAYGHL